jgi:hypothetical protein
MDTRPSAGESNVWRASDFPKDYIDEENGMAQNHYVTKTKRRQKSGKRKDPSQATMAKLRQLAAAQAKSSGK